jgi:nitrogen-specific signal transduction histidine kinase
MEFPPPALLARLPGLIYRCHYNAARTLEFASAGCHALLGLTAAELVRDGVGLTHFICPPDRARVSRELAETLARQDAFACEYHIKHAGTGQPLVVWEQGRAVHDVAGTIIAPAPRRRDFQLQQERSFNSINQLAAGLAHDFNNIIAGIVGSAEVIKMDLPPDQPDNPILEQIFTAGHRASEMINQMRIFSQRQPCIRTVLQLPPVVEETLNLLRANLPASVEIVRQLDPKCPAVFADATQIQQVIISLVTNAWHSLAGPSGRIEVRLEPCEVGAELAAANPGLQEGPHVRLSVCDNGDHFSPNMLRRMFEPFACKQITGHNSGLELFTVREIVHAHDGEITVHSVSGEGTVFQLYFPVVTPAAGSHSVMEPDSGLSS